MLQQIINSPVTFIVPYNYYLQIESTLFENFYQIIYDGIRRSLSLSPLTTVGLDSLVVPSTLPRFILNMNQASPPSVSPDESGPWSVELSIFMSLLLTCRDGCVTNPFPFFHFFSCNVALRDVESEEISFSTTRLTGEKVLGRHIQRIEKGASAHC